MTTVLVYTLLLITCFLLLSETHIVDIMTTNMISIRSGLCSFWFVVVFVVDKYQLADLFSGLKT